MSDSEAFESLNGMRRFFRIHLLTAILLTFAAGGIIRLNVGQVPVGQAPENDWAYSHHSYGWPFEINPRPIFQVQPFRWAQVGHVAMWSPTPTSSSQSSSSSIEELNLALDTDPDCIATFYGLNVECRRIHWRYFIGDLAVSTAILIVLAFIFELALFRRSVATHAH